ncbi:putative D,D-dipeptide transport system permease protein DdpC [compost metagenome]|jgi:peptide/nickel transport system permease protein
MTDISIPLPASRGFGARLFRRKPVFLSLLVLGLLVLLALLAPWISPYSPVKLSVMNRLNPPSVAHWFGTDEFGRDVLSRTIFAARLSLLVGFCVMLLSVFFGVALGLLAGFFRKLDTPIARVIDALMAFPDVLLAIALVAALGPSLATVIIALAIVYTPRVARIVRASTLVIRELPYIEAAHALAIPVRKILVRHVLTNLVAPVLVQGSFVFAYAMLAEAGLSFLGLGVSPDIPTWGTMISSGRQYIGQAMWMTLFPGGAIVLAVLSLQVLGDGCRDLLDPRMRKDF